MQKALIFLLLVAPALASAQAEELENPGTVSAVQERAYRMNHELTLGVGAAPLDAFYKSYYGQIAYVFHFSDSFAWQVGRGAYTYNMNTGLREQLERDFGVLPTAFDEIQYFVGSDLLWSPLYGKMALLNTSVLHFEDYLILGVTAFKFTNHFRPAVNLGVGVRLFHSKYVSYRLDFTNNFVISEKPFNVITLQLQAAVNFGATE
ncbi:MAG: outer membrane beta-barrel domain-containing protein [Myxococcaceae bacterium]